MASIGPNPALDFAAPPVNDEEPSDASMDRLWEALEAALDPPPPPPAQRRHVRCLHCGYKWAPRVPHPTCCAMCHVGSWDRPPQFRRPSRPSTSDPTLTNDSRTWTAKIKRRNERRRRRRRQRVAEEIARSLGMELVPARLRDVAPPVAAAALEPPAAFRRTVPPPPGSEDLR